MNFTEPTKPLSGSWCQGGVAGLVALALTFGAARAGDLSLTGDAVVARRVLTEIQPVSVAENREYCGYIFRRDDGTYHATQPMAGGPDWCDAMPPFNVTVVASYHTHAGYDPEAWSELPSGTDMEADEDEGIDGYVATPGGRFWYIDTVDMIASQICGIGCLPQDPDFRPAPDDNIRNSYSYDDLIEKLR